MGQPHANKQHGIAVVRCFHELTITRGLDGVLDAGKGRATGRPSGDRTPRSTAVVGASCGPMGSLETTEIGAQTEAMPGVAHAEVQVGEGRLLTVDKLREKATIEELAVSDTLKLMCDVLPFVVQGRCPVHMLATTKDISKIHHTKLLEL